MANHRCYNSKDVEMLMAAKTVAHSFNENMHELANARTNWSPEYGQDLQARITQAFETHLGHDRKKGLREATEKLRNIHEPAMRDLAFLKAQVEVDFGMESKGILKDLGLKPSLRESRLNNQESMIEVLHAMRKGLQSGLRQRILEKGTDASLLDRIEGYCSQILEANVVQEGMKESSREITAEAIGVFNAIYNEIIGICKIAAKYYQTEPLRRDRFTYAKVLANMKASNTALID